MTFSLSPTPDGVDLVVTGDWTPQARERITAGEADGLVLNYAKGFHEPDIDFIAGLPIRRLHILDRTLKDLTPVHTLGASLVTLHVQSDPRATIELERLPRLTHLSASWPQVHGSIRYAQELERLFLLSYTEPDLTPLSHLPGLTSIVMKDYPAVHSLDGAQDLPWLAELGIHLAKHLDDISALDHPSSLLLNTLQLTHCKKIADITAVAACPSLTYLNLSENGNLTSAAPLAGLRRLEKLYLYGSTNILDGDLTPIAGLPRLNDFRMQNRRHYQPSARDIEAAIAARNQP